LRIRLTMMSAIMSLQHDRTCFRVIPVLDVLHGKVVHGIGGRRHEYQPIISCLTDSTNPLEVATAFRANLGLTELYIADLDGIMHRLPDLHLIRELADNGFRLWVDAGMRSEADAMALHQSGANVVVAGLETVSSPSELRSIVDLVSAANVCFSLDLKAGRPIAQPAWGDTVDPIAEIVIEIGIRRFIILDLADVGERRGCSTGELCRALHRRFPNVQFVLGGGVRNRGDLQFVQESGASVALAATALHDGQITRLDLKSLAQFPRG